ncbi:MAG: M28 family peptidase [Proteobacteria bacterium]|nr:M28 family peptidase [Pseudomonadota bacterium]
MKNTANLPKKNKSFCFIGYTKYTCALIILLMFFTVDNGFSANSQSKSINIPVNIKQMRQDVEALTTIDPPRNYKNIKSLNKSAEYILKEFNKTGCTTRIQSFVYDKNEYKNVICSFGPEDGERIVVGAHYDVHGNQPGADDNASGVAGLLELSRLVNSLKPSLKYRIDFVAYTLEEPKLFRTRHMGSYVHAESLANAGVQVRAMISLEMIGYFSDTPKSQKYPVFFLKWFYPDIGNFISVVGKWGQGDFVESVRKNISEAANMPVESIAAPSFLPGIDFSDHQSFWRFHYKALMITDTAFYRNRNYHETTDTIDTLDFNKMAEVVKGLYWTIVNLSK